AGGTPRWRSERDPRLRLGWDRSLRSRWDSSLALGVGPRFRRGWDQRVDMTSPDCRSRDRTAGLFPIDGAWVVIGAPQSRAISPDHANGFTICKAPNSFRLGMS